MNAFFLFRTLTFNNNVAVTLQSKSFLQKSNVKPTCFFFLFFKKAVFSLRNTGFSSDHHILTEAAALCDHFFFF